MEQLSLTDSPAREVEAPAPEPDLTIEERYHAWISQNPQVLGLFERFALEASQRGKKFSIYLLRERIRWEIKMQWEKDGDDFKLNNNYTPYIARDLIERHPEYAELIELRSMKGTEGAWH